MSVENPPSKGLANLGNTCYLNTVIQMLSAIPEFHSFQPKSPLYKKRDQHPIFIQWNELLQNLLSPPTTPHNQTIHPGMFIQTLFQHAKSKSFQPNRNEPQDAAEFLQFLIEEFHEILAHPVKVKVQGNRETDKDDMAKICYDMLAEIYAKNYSEIYPLCYGTTVSQITPITPPDSKPVSMRPETFFLLPLPLPPGPPFPFQSITPLTLYECLDQIIAPEIMENENAWFDDTLRQKRAVSKQTLFWNFPPLLCFTLQRLLPDGNKDNRVIRFPIDKLDLSPYVRGYNKEQYVYELMAIGLHHGDIGGGHYTAGVRRAGGTWVHYNDHMVNALPAFPPEMPVNEVQQEMEKMLYHPDVYCLLYRKIPTAP
jgi:ubiquitin carboxyl-terminal hydrolase 8